MYTDYWNIYFKSLYSIELYLKDYANSGHVKSDDVSAYVTLCCT
jgi:hypothetical protein